MHPLPLRTLVYMGCFMDPVYAEATRVSIATLRGNGRYAGDVAVLTDGTFPETDGVTTIRVPAPKDAFDLKCTKLRVARLLDLSRYDRVLWLDSDVVAVADVQPLFEFCAHGLAAADEYPFNTMRRDSVGGALRWWERFRYRNRYGVNAGVFCADARSLPGYLDLWEAEVRRCRGRLERWIDQPPLNALICRGRIAFRPYPRGWIEMPPLYELLGNGLRFSMKPETRLLHYCALPDKTETVRRMRAHV